MIGELIPTGVTFGVGRVSLNTQFSGTADFNNVEISGNLSAGTGGAIYSGGTDLYNIFSTSGSDTNFANTNLTFTGNRDHDTDGNYLIITTDNGAYNGGWFVIDPNYVNLGCDNYGLYSDIGTFAINGDGSRFLASSGLTVINNGGSDIDFRIEGDTDENLLFVDASADNIGIGKIPGAYKLDVSGDTNVSGVIYSGGTDLYNIFGVGGGSTTASNGLTKTGDNITLGGLMTGNTILDASSSATFLMSGNANNSNQFKVLTTFGSAPAFLQVGRGSARIRGENATNTERVEFEVSNGANPSGLLSYLSISGEKSISFSSTVFLITDTHSSKGIEYAANYHTNYTTRSIVDKEYVDNLTANYLPLVITATTIVNVDDNSLFFTGNSASSITTAILGGDGGDRTHAVQVTDDYALLGSQDASLVDFYYLRASQIDGASLEFNTGTTISIFKVTKSSIRAQSSIPTFAGITYDIDYSANYTNRSLVDKGYVDNAISTASTSSVGINPYNDLGDVASSFTWNVSGDSTNYEVTLTAATTTVNLTNVRNGEYGTIIVNQDGVGGRAITLGTVNGAGTTHRVANGGGGSIILTSNANAIDILTFTYNGSAMYWTVGNDYT